MLGDVLGPGAAGGTREGGVAAASSDGFWRLEQAVARLVESQRTLAGENARLRGALSEREEKLRSLELELLERNQARQDAAKRVDELIRQVAQLEARLDTAPVDTAPVDTAPVDTAPE